MAAHHHDPAGAGDQPFEDVALAHRRLAEHGVRGKDQRRSQAVDEIEDHFAIGAAENAIFVLQPHGIDTAGVDAPGGFGVIFRIVPHDRPGDAAVSHRLARIVERINIHRDFRVELIKLVEDVGGESGDAALARRVVADQRDVACRGNLSRWQGEDRTDGRAFAAGMSQFFSGGRVQSHYRIPKGFSGRSAAHGTTLHCNIVYVAMQ